MNLRQIFLSSEPLLIFMVIGLGFLVGQIKIRGFSLGVAGVLFVGLAIGAWAPPGEEPFHIAEQIIEVGLILFVYAVGLTSGPGFFASFRLRGVRFNLAVTFSLLVGAVLTFLMGRSFQLPIGQIAGVFCGGLTNTPALAAVTELIKTTNPDHVSDPTVGYSLAYPFGVMGGLLAFQLFTWIFQKQFHQEKAQALSATEGPMKLLVKNFEIRNPNLFDRAIGELRVQEKTGVIISRLRHGSMVVVPTKYTHLREGDVVIVVGTQENIDRARDYFGVESTENLESVQDIEMRRILVSRKQTVGLTIKELELDQKFNAQITRLRRADIEIVPSPDTMIELGDRLRVVMPKDKAAQVSEFFGDSERGIAELDYTAITLGISLGVLVGMIPIPLPGGGRVALGFAGGPLLVGLILGKLGRTGPLVWSIPLEANQALRHIGLLFFLAGVGVTAGGSFQEALSSSGVQLFLLGMLTTSVTTSLTLFLLRYFGKASVIGAMGATSGMQTQPATLARAYEMSQSEETYVAYATTYPVAMIGKILLAQLILIIGQRMG